MGEEPLAIVQCDGCTWWWFFWDRRPTIPFICTLCKSGQPTWEVGPRIITPMYGTEAPYGTGARRRQDTLPFGLDEEPRPRKTLPMGPPEAPPKKRKKRH